MRRAIPILLFIITIMITHFAADMIANERALEVDPLHVTAILDATLGPDPLPALTTEPQTPEEEEDQGISPAFIIGVVTEMANFTYGLITLNPWSKDEAFNYIFSDETGGRWPKYIMNVVTSVFFYVLFIDWALSSGSIWTQLLAAVGGLASGVLRFAGPLASRVIGIFTRS